MEDRKVYICYTCTGACPCVAVTDGEPELKCLHGHPIEGAAWREVDPVLASGILSALAEEQRGRC